MKKIILLVFVSIVVSMQAYSQDCDPEITETSGGGTYCLNEEVTLSITGDLDNANEWQWYIGECKVDDNKVGTGTSITVKVTKTTSYYVVATGDCVADDQECAEIIIVLDDEPPVVTTCPDDIIVEAEEGKCEVEVTYEEPTGTDNCSDELEVELIEGLGPDMIFPVGTTTEKYVITDENGNKAECIFTVTVKDTQVPVITCPEDIEVNNDPGECGAVVDYTDPVVSDNCTGFSLERIEGLASGSLFPVGITTVSYTASDASGNTSSCSFLVTVNDVEPPVITVKDKKISQWPPNHKPFEIQIEDYIESVYDNCPDVSIDDIIISEASSDEPVNGKGDGNTTDDIVIGDDCRTIHLLAERQGGGNGRVYTIELAVADASGNIGTAEIKAEIRPNNGKNSSVIDDGPEYIVEGCDPNPDDGEDTVAPLDDTSSRLNISTLETYPNPFNSSFEIQFTPMSDDRITVDLYTFTGAKLKGIFAGDVKADENYSWIFDSGNLNDELYILLIQGNKSYAFKRIVRK